MPSLVSITKRNHLLISKLIFLQLPQRWLLPPSTQQSIIFSPYFYLGSLGLKRRLQYPDLTILQNIFTTSQTYMLKNFLPLHYFMNHSRLFICQLTILHCFFQNISMLQHKKRPLLIQTVIQRHRMYHWKLPFILLIISSNLPFITTLLPYSFFRATFNITIPTLIFIQIIP